MTSTPLRPTLFALVLACIVGGTTDCAMLNRVEDPAQLGTDAVCLAITALVDDGTTHEVCATAQELAPFVDALIRRRKAAAAAARETAEAQRVALRPLRMRPVRVTAAELAALDCGIPSDHPSQRP